MPCKFFPCRKLKHHFVFMIFYEHWFIIIFSLHMFARIQPFSRPHHLYLSSHFKLHFIKHFFFKEKRHEFSFKFALILYTSRGFQFYVGRERQQLSADSSHPWFYKSANLIFLQASAKPIFKLLSVAFRLYLFLWTRKVKTFRRCFNETPWLLSLFSLD